MKTTGPESEKWARNKLVTFRQCKEDAELTSMETGMFAVYLLICGFLCEAVVKLLCWPQDCVLGITVLMLAAFSFFNLLRSLRAGIAVWYYQQGISDLEAGLQKQSKDKP